MVGISNVRWIKAKFEIPEAVLLTKLIESCMMMFVEALSEVDMIELKDIRLGESAPMMEIIGLAPKVVGAAWNLKETTRSGLDTKFLMHS